jgi:hypothetical protein
MSEVHRHAIIKIVLRHTFQSVPVVIAGVIDQNGNRPPPLTDVSYQSFQRGCFAKVETMKLRALKPAVGDAVRNCLGRIRCDVDEGYSRALIREPPVMKT